MLKEFGFKALAVANPTNNVDVPFIIFVAALDDNTTDTGRKVAITFMEQTRKTNVPTVIEEY